MILLWHSLLVGPLLDLLAGTKVLALAVPAAKVPVGATAVATVVDQALIQALGGHDCIDSLLVLAILLQELPRPIAGAIVGRQIPWLTVLGTFAALATGTVGPIVGLALAHLHGVGHQIRDVRIHLGTLFVSRAKSTGVVLGTLMTLAAGVVGYTR